MTIETTYNKNKYDVTFTGSRNGLSIGTITVKNEEGKIEKNPYVIFFVMKQLDEEKGGGFSPYVEDKDANRYDVVCDTEKGIKIINAVGEEVKSHWIIYNGMKLLIKKGWGNFYFTLNEARKIS